MNDQANENISENFNDAIFSSNKTKPNNEWKFYRTNELASLYEVRALAGAVVTFTIRSNKFRDSANEASNKPQAQWTRHEYFRNTERKIENHVYFDFI